MQHSTRNQQLLFELSTLIDAVGDNLLTKKIHIDSLNVKQTILYLTFAAVNSYSESIYVLIRDFRAYPASIIMRSIIEAYINTGYILSHNSDKRAYLYSLEDSYYRLGLLDSVDQYYKKYPNQKQRSSIDVGQLLAAKPAITEELAAYTKVGLNYNNHKLFSKDYGNLLQRALAVDRRRKGGNFEHVYIWIYKYFSEFGHLSMRGINHFIKNDNQGNKMVLAGQSEENIEMLIVTLYTIYLYFLTQLVDRDLIEKSFPLAKFVRVWKTSINQIPKQ